VDLSASQLACNVDHTFFLSSCLQKPISIKQDGNRANFLFSVKLVCSFIVIFFLSLPKLTFVVQVWATILSSEWCVLFFVVGALALKPNLVKTGIRSFVWYMCAPLHCISLESRLRRPLQNHCHMPDLCQDQERLPNMSAGP